MANPALLVLDAIKGWSVFGVGLLVTVASVNVCGAQQARQLSCAFSDAARARTQ
jgi:hypothetical protein